MSLSVFNPFSDTRWDDLVARHPRASVFHEKGWLEALARTYGYEPLVVTLASDTEPLVAGIVLCRVSSWITGTRLVSLPFSDHCDPLLDDPARLPELVDLVRAESDRQGCRYVELRPISQLPELGSEFRGSSEYCLHALDLLPSLERLFARLHKNSIQRKIRRSEKERLSYEKGRSERLVEEFYGLLVMTRKRHRLLPQPRAWFSNLLECLGDKIQIRIARKDRLPIAAIVSLSKGKSVVYKYGCSDERFHNLGGIPFLFWRLIEESKASGAEVIDLGRSDWDHHGLITFKDRLGAERTPLKYYRYAHTNQDMKVWWDLRTIRGCLPMLPKAVLSAAGAALYRHMG